MFQQPKLKFEEKYCAMISLNRTKF